MTNLDSVLKSRDITLPTKVHIVQAVVSPVKTKLHTVKTYGLTTVRDHWKDHSLNYMDLPLSAE